MILASAALIFTANAAEVVAGAVNPALPLGRFECKIDVGDHEGESLIFDNLASGVSIVQGGSFTSFTGATEGESVTREFDGGVVEGIQFDVASQDGEVRFSLDKVSDKKTRTFRIWIMRQVGSPTSSGVGEYFTHTVAFAFSAFGKCKASGKSI
jgi:hypothetical protein